ncbi:3'-5' exonuclease [Thiomicrospira cyclica]|uniref:Exonuclease RNase T and DNA polymerase III n=1 Tax=Thiomicrospira cyclica (strain DSM 14477 / JCM 11371 / ALM1) TaxID=717773 RepID=F6DCQ4_THICA|nr:3'-5' exonuclease [Thiomicrospira cyclica]AEG31640.1 Exonuclease RNase T and DNA polymerase III [Thiomicrospira cyclica ALM1]
MVLSSLRQSLHQAWLKWQLRDPAYDFLFAPEPDQEVVCFDCETTGLDPAKDKIVTLSAIKIRGREILTSESLNLQFKQQRDINPESILIHQLRNMDVTLGLDEREAIEQFLVFIGSRPLVGYYLSFDVSMVNAIIKPWLGIPLPNRQLDVAELYHQQFYQDWLQPDHEVFDLSFKTLLSKLNLPTLGQHDAFNDALMTAMIYVRLQANLD